MQNTATPTMGFGVCTLYSKPPFFFLHCLPHPKQGILLESLVLGRVSTRGAPGVAKELANNRNGFLEVKFARVKLTSKWGPKKTNTMLTNSRQLISSVYVCIRTIIFGYWMGPDIQDGWGFVEAVVDRIVDC